MLVPADAVPWLDAASRVPMLTTAEELHLGGLVQAWQQHPAGPAGAPPGIRRSGLRARNRIVSANLRLVAMVVRRTAGEENYTDHMQEGVFGLIRAAERFDPARGYKFSTFAYLWIRQGQQTGALSDPMIRLPAPVASAVHGRRNGACSAKCLEAGLAVAGGLYSLDCTLPGTDTECTLGELTPAPTTAGLEEIARFDLVREALAAMRQADPDVVAMLELAAQGHGPTDVGVAAGVSVHKAKAVMNAARDRLRSLPEVAEALAELAMQ